MDNNTILYTAMCQSAYDLNADVSDFLSGKNKVIVSKHLSPTAKKYYKEPIACNFVSYGNNVVASAMPRYKKIVESYVSSAEFYYLFETPSIHTLNNALLPYGQRVCYMAEYWLPDLNILSPLTCPFPTKIMEKSDFSELYTPAWSNALCKDRKELDVLGIGAYDGERLVGFAACSADADDMWQIGVDVLPEYRKNGVASSLTSMLATEIIKRGKVPFYCCAWSNIPSAKNAMRSGFKPAWVEMTVKPILKENKL